MSGYGYESNSQKWVPNKVTPDGASVAADAALASIVDKVDANTTIICEAMPGSLSSDAVWRICKVVVSGSVTRTYWAGGGNFTQVADNRASLTFI